MFFLIDRDEKLQLHPQHFGKNLNKQIHRELKLKVEGKCTGRYGYTVAVLALKNIGKGQLHEDTGYAHFPITYTSLVFRPFRNEILPAVVSTINDNGFFAQAGPLEIFVSKVLMPNYLKYDEKREGLPCYYSEEEDIRIEQGSSVRIKIVGIRFAADKISVVGTIKEDFLG